MKHCISELAEVYPQLYLDPGSHGIDEYKRIVLGGGRSDTTDLSHFSMDERDSCEEVETPAGSVKVVTLYKRRDFETFVRCMMAAKQGPDHEIPATMGGSTIVAFNWPRIYAHKDEFMRREAAKGNSDPDWNAEFRRFTSVRDNYIDMLIVLSCGPYSNISAEQAGMSEDKWLAVSRDIRIYHECTHFICRRLFPDRIDAVWDELVADAAGIYGALGRYDMDLECLFLGIGSDGSYTGGRLENYVKREESDGRMLSDAEYKAELDRISASALSTLRQFEQIIDAKQGEPVFDVMLALEATQP